MQRDVNAECASGCVLAAAWVNALAAWCLVSAVNLTCFAGPLLQLESELPSPGPLFAPLASAAIPTITGIVLLARGRRAVEWSARRGLQGSSTAPGSGWMAVGLPLVAVTLFVLSAVAAAFDVCQALVVGTWTEVWRASLPALLGALLLVTAPWLARAWTACNQPRPTSS